MLDKLRVKVELVVMKHPGLWEI